MDQDLKTALLVLINQLTGLVINLTKISQHEIDIIEGKH